MGKSKANPADCGVGDRVGRYRVEDRLGKGAMGEVYLCHDEGLGRDVAVKVLSEAHRYNAELRARFVREARAVARITHPNVVQIYLTDEHDGLPYLAMEYLRGRDLGSLLADKGPLSDAGAVAVVRRAAEGLRAAAAVGVVHRDVKPANILVTDEGEVKLTDFGLAKTINVDPELTATGLIVGTPDFISPEQARGEKADSRSDIYSLGCTLYHLIAGRPPFRTDDGPNTYMAILSRHIHQARPNLAEVVAGSHPDVAALVQRMMATHPDDRPDFDGLVSELSSLERRLGGAVPQVSGPSKTDGHPTVLDRPSSSGERGDYSASDRSEQSERRAEARPHTLVVRTGLPGWSLVLSVLSLAVFLVGIGLRFSGAAPSRELSFHGNAPALPPRSTDAGVFGQGGPQGVELGPEVPWSTVFVSGRNGPGGLYVEVRPVSILQWKQFASRSEGKGKNTTKDEPSSNALQDKDPRALLPVTGVTFFQARAFAMGNGARLPSRAEWDAIRRTRGLLFPDPSLWEWVSGAAGRRRAWVMRRDGSRSEKKEYRGYGNVTFRLVWDAK